MPDLTDVIQRAQLEPWADPEGKIPWHDPAFSQRMLTEHLSQDHDVESDLRGLAFDGPFDLALLIHGELNTFTPDEARALLAAVAVALGPLGVVALEVHTEDHVRSVGEGPATWFTSEGGLFSPAPHLVLRESAWRDGARASVERYFVANPETGSVDRYLSTLQAYDERGYTDLLASAGLEHVARLPSLEGPTGASDPGMFVILARRAART